jgi:hypothetical protein
VSLGWRPAAIAIAFSHQGGSVVWAELASQSGGILPQLPGGEDGGMPKGFGLQFVLL